jgi:hypothetical protein
MHRERRTHRAAVPACSRGRKPPESESAGADKPRSGDVVSGSQAIIATLPLRDWGRARHRRIARTVTAAFLAGLLLKALTTGAAEPRFVRAGIVVDEAGAVKLLHTQTSTTETIQLDAGRRLVRFDWSPEHDYVVIVGNNRYALRAPLAPAPYLVRTIDLEDVSQAAAAGVSPDSIVRFAPDSRRLAIGTFGGWLRVVDCYTGEVLHRRRVAEGMVKSLAWSPNGRFLYVGEQSPDANLYALDIRSAVRDAKWPIAWTARLADQIETSRPPAGDRYGIYTLPAVFDLKAADDGRLFAAGVHSWPGEEGQRNRSALSCFGPDGKLLWRFPETWALPLTLMHFAVDPGGRRLVFLASQSQAPANDQPLRTDTLYQLDARTGRPAGQHRIAPFAPHFTRVESWDSVSVADDAARVAIGLGDGRGFILESTDEALRPVAELPLGTPIVVGGIPIAAGASYTRSIGGRFLFQTQNTHIPFGSAQAANQAPSVHRGANTLTVTDRDGKTLWRYRGPYGLSGNVGGRGREGRRWLVVPCRELPGSPEPGQFGFLLFDLEASGGGSERLVYHYPTAGPVIFHADLSPDGRLVAVVEVPAPTLDGLELYGTHRVHVVH